MGSIKGPADPMPRGEALLCILYIIGLIVGVAGAAWVFAKLLESLR